MNQTKKYKWLYFTSYALSILLNIGPLAVYSIKAYTESALVVDKVTLTMTVLIVLILSAVAFLNKTTMRSRVWVITLGLYFCLDSFITPILVIAITQIVDEWIMAPLSKAFKQRYVINKQIDKRG